MNKKEMLVEIKRLREEMKTLDFNTRSAIINRQNELLELSKVNITKGGAVRYYLPTTATLTSPSGCLILSKIFSHLLKSKLSDVGILKCLQT